MNEEKTKLVPIASWQQRFVSVAFFGLTAKKPSHVSSVCLCRTRNSHEAAFLPADSAIGDRDRHCTYHAARSLLRGRNCCRSQRRSAIAVLDRLRGFQFLTLPFHSSAALSKREICSSTLPSVICVVAVGKGKQTPQEVKWVSLLNHHLFNSLFPLDRRRTSPAQPSSISSLSRTCVIRRCPCRSADLLAVPEISINRICDGRRVV